MQKRRYCCNENQIFLQKFALAFAAFEMSLHYRGVIHRKIMKRIGIIISILAMAAATSSCMAGLIEPSGLNNNDDEYYYALKKAKTYFATTVKYSQSDFGYEYLSDGGYYLIPDSKYKITDYTPSEGNRVIITGLITGALKGTEKDSIMTLFYVQNVLTKQIISLEDGEKIGNYAKNPITPESAWLGGGYINVYFVVEGSNTVEHSLNLVYNPNNQGNLSANTIRLTLAHNANGDNGSIKMQGIASFKNSFGKDITGFVIDAQTISDGVRDFQVDISEPDYLNF